MTTGQEEYPWLNELNAQQRKAVTHGEGPLLVVAGAGSGKTGTIAYRVAYLIATGVDPERILLLTFTRRAAEEMIKRAVGITQRSHAAVAKVWGGTFHGIANRLLRIYGPAAGLNADFTVMDESDAQDMMSVVRHELNLASRDKRFPLKKTCLDIYSRCVNGTEDLHEVLKRFFPWCAMWEKELKTLFKQYVTRKQALNVLDYDDLLLYWEQLLRDEDLAATVERRFDHILVDEYQDTNLVQARILQGMRKTNTNVMVVGDDAQSIYSFRAATVRNMLDFPKQFPGATVITLDQNYRSVSPILEATNQLIAQARERFTKDLWSSRTSEQKPYLVTCKDEDQQDEFVIRKVLEHYEQGIPLRRQAVLFRAAHLSDSLEVELTRRKIPYHKYGGLRFLEASHVKDLVAYLRITENPRDEMAWFRVLHLLDGVGPATAAAAVAFLHGHRDEPGSLAEFPAPSAARQGVRSLAAMFSQLGEGATPSARVERIRLFYDPILEKRYENPVVRKRDLEHLEQIATGYRSTRSFLTDLTLDPPMSTGDLAGPPMKDEDWLVLSTIHSAKGCEWDVVYVTHMSDGCLPSDMSTGSAEEIEEELRLAYVAMTRAKDFLYVSWPLRYYHRKQRFTDHHSYAQASRFLSAGVCNAFERLTLTQADAPDTTATPSSAKREEIRSRLRSMWD